jgi:hypothetical protein
LSCNRKCAIFKIAEGKVRIEQSHEYAVNRGPVFRQDESMTDGAAKILEHIKKDRTKYDRHLH